MGQVGAVWERLGLSPAAALGVEDHLAWRCPLSGASIIGTLVIAWSRRAGLVPVKASRSRPAVLRACGPRLNRRGPTRGLAKPRLWAASRHRRVSPSITSRNAVIAEPRKQRRAAQFRPAVRPALCAGTARALAMPRPARVDQVVCSGARRPHTNPGWALLQLARPRRTSAGSVAVDRVDGGFEASFMMRRASASALFTLSGFLRPSSAVASSQDFDRRTVVIREGKGGKDRVVTMPRSIEASLRAHMARIRALRVANRRAGVPGVFMPTWSGEATCVRGAPGPSSQVDLEGSLRSCPRCPSA